MWDILKDVAGFVWALIEPFREPLLTGLTIAVVAVLVVRITVPIIAQRWEMFRSKTTKQHHRAKDALLTLPDLRELYAPAELHTVRVLEDDDGKKPFKPKLAWLSPYPRAVKTSYKKNRVGKNDSLNARAQVKEAARNLAVTDVPEDAGIELDNADDHFLVTLDLGDKDREHFRRMQGKMQGKLGAKQMDEYPSPSNKIAFIVHMVEAEDVLVKRKTGGEFFDEHPAKTQFSLPLAVKGNGDPWSLPLHHTLIYGATGSGKGSPFQGIIHQLAPFVKDGTCELYGIDPKGTELKAYEHTDLFKGIVTNPDAAEGQQLIYAVLGIMKDRATGKRIDLSRADLGRDFVPSKDQPVVVLMIDELVFLLAGLKELGKPGQATMNHLVQMLAMGRSLGVYIVAATQAIDKDLLGRMRVNFANTVVLKQDSAWNNDFILGDGAKEQGFDSTAIPESNKANGYRYSGIGFVKEEGGRPVKVRFAYSADRDIADLCLAFNAGDFDSHESDFETPEMGGGDEFALPDPNELAAVEWQWEQD